MGEVRSNRVVARVIVLRERAGRREVLLCRSRNGKHWVPPGGTLDPGETLGQAAVREVLEESGIQVRVDRLLGVQEFRPAGRAEHVVEVLFLARPLLDRPADDLVANGAVEPAGPESDPWAAWLIQDVDGPRRRVTWAGAAEIAALSDPVYPIDLRGPFWAQPLPPPGLYREWQAD